MEHVPWRQECVHFGACRNRAIGQIFSLLKDSLTQVGLQMPATMLISVLAWMGPWMLATLLTALTGVGLCACTHMRAPTSHSRGPVANRPQPTQVGDHCSSAVWIVLPSRFVCLSTWLIQPAECIPQISSLAVLPWKHLVCVSSGQHNCSPLNIELITNDSLPALLQKFALTRNRASIVYG